MMITASQCRAGRALSEVSRETLAEHSGVEEETIFNFERRLNQPDAANLDKLARALEDMGVVFIPENGGGIGVRLKFTRSEARRILSLENEGGQVGEDEVP